MKKISYEELGKYIGKKASKYFDRYYSDNIYDYSSEISNCNSEYDGVNDCYNCSIELAEVGKSPLIIEFVCRYIYNKNENIVDTIYYI